VSTPTPEPTAQTVVADVHEVLDAAKTGALEVVAAVESVGFGTVLDDAKKVIHDSIEALKASLRDLFHGAQPSAPAPTQAPPIA
jgi:ribosomal protein L1